MNTFLGVAIYSGDHFTDNGLRFMEMQIPKTGKSGNDTPIYVVPNRAAGESFDVFQPGARILVSGRLYPSRADYKMYLVPNQQFALVNDKNLQINKVNISGGVGYIPDKSKEDLFTFTIMCSAPAQMVLGHNWEDSLSFRMESWGEDAIRLEKMLHVGRQVSIEGVLRYNTWAAQDGSTRGMYQVRVRAGLYSAFGKNKKLVEVVQKVSESTTHYSPQPIMLPKMEYTKPVDASVVNEEEVPF